MCLENLLLPAPIKLDNLDSWPTRSLARIFRQRAVDVSLIFRKDAQFLDQPSQFIGTT